MSELRYRPADEATAAGPDRADRPDRTGRPGVPHERDHHADSRATADSRPARDTGPRYDADAEYKRPVPKPEGYLPGDSGGTAPPVELPDRGYWLRDRAGSSDLAQGRDPAQAPPLREASEGERADPIRAVVDRPDFRDPIDRRSPDRYGDPLTRPDGTRVPCFDGPPQREQAGQGWTGDCGVIAALGAVAAHKPEELARRIRPQADGSYKVTLSETRQQRTGVSEPTGRDVEITVTPELPVYDGAPGEPACATIDSETAWGAVAEKALAGADETWTPERRASWEDAWARMCAYDQARGITKPRSGPAPTGYVRLHQGTTPWEQAEVLTQLTGQPAEVREFPHGSETWKINRHIRAQLNEGKPVLVGSRQKEYDSEKLPYGLEAGHVYEVVGLEKGQILLRNPWNTDHPEPMETVEFAHNMSRYYSTLS